MLSPDYLLHISEGAEEIAEQIHVQIINQVVKRIMLRMKRGDNYILTAQDKWQLETLEQAGFLMEDIQREIAKRTPLMQKEVAEAMEEAGVKALKYDDKVYEAAGLSPKPLDQSPNLIRIMQRNYEATMGEWKNFTRTTATATQQAFITACDNIYNMVTTGAQSYSGGFKEAINQLIEQGVYVTYDTGHRDTIETATLRAVRTGVSQSTAQITDTRMDEMGWDIILVSSHLGARVTAADDYTNHSWWQGKFYSKSGKNKKFPPFAVCGMGNVQGIHGANCRHSHGPGDGVNNPFEQFDSERNLEEYNLQQRQRELERRIRDTKRKVLNLRTALDNSPESVKMDYERLYQRKSALLQKQNALYNKFCEENDLKKLSERITIAKWDRKQAAQARAAAGRWKEGHSEAPKAPKVEKPKNQTRIVTTRAEAYKELTGPIGFHAVRSKVDSLNEQLLVENVNRLSKLENRFGAVHKCALEFDAANDTNAIAYVAGYVTEPSRGELSLCRGYFSVSKEKFVEITRNAVQTFWSMPCAPEDFSVYSVTHEYGHIIQNTRITDEFLKNGWDPDDTRKFIRYERKTKKARFKWYYDLADGVRKRDFDEIVSIAKERNPGFKLSENLSQYGRTNYAEFFAEVFANSQCGKPNELGQAMIIWLERIGF